MLDWLGRLAERRARWVVAGWVAAAVVLLVVAPSLEKVGVQDQTSFLPASSPAQQAQRVLQRLYPNDPTLNAGIVVFSRSQGPLTGADRDWIRQWVAGLASPTMRGDFVSVESDATDPALASELQSGDGHADLVVLGFRAAPFAAANNRAVSDLRAQLARTAPAGLEHHLTGVAGLGADQASSVLSSFGRATVMAVALVLVLLIVVYGSVLAPLVPLLTIGLAYLVARGLIGILAAHGFKVASLVDTFLIVMVFGAGTDYCLFVVARHRETMASPAGVTEPLRHSLGAVGSVIIASGATVVVGFLSMLTAKFGLYRTMGPAIGIAIVVTVAASLTLGPALIKLGGARLMPAKATADSDGVGRWDRLAAAVRSHPIEILLAGIIFMELSASGLGWYRQNFDLVKELPPRVDARQGYEVIARHYPGGTDAPIYVVLDSSGPIITESRLAAIDRLTDYLKTQPGIAQVRSVTQPAGAPLTSTTLNKLGGSGSLRQFGIDPNKVDVTPLLNAIDSPGGLRFDADLIQRYPQVLDGPLSFFEGADGHSTRLMVTLKGDPYAASALDVVRGLDTKVDDNLAGSALSGAHLSIGGPVTFFSDMQTVGNHDLRVIAAVLVAAVFVVLALLLRSLVAPFYLLASVLISYAATLGITAGVFDGIFQQDGLSFWLPPFLLVILVALGADYTIFIMSRIREEVGAGADIPTAVTRGLTATGRVITSAGLILAGAFAALVTAPLGELRQIGFAVTVGVLIDTFVVRSLLVPAATVLLGRWAFWPGIPAISGRRAPRRHIGLAGAATLALAVGLVVLATTGGAAKAVYRVAARQMVTPASRPASGTAGGALLRAAPTTATTSRPAPAPTSVPPTFSAVGASTSATTAKPAAPPPSRSTAPTTVPSRITVPATGAWRYQVRGTRKIGTAGSTQSFSETDGIQVSQQRSNSTTAVMQVVIQTSTYTETDQRQYSPNGVDLLATQFSADGITYGGNLQPPQQLIPWPAAVGQSWSSNWTTGSTNGHTSGQITGTKTLTVAGTAYQCYVVQTSTTFSGSAQGSQKGTTCWSRQLGMALQDDETISGTYSGIPFDITTHFLLLSPP